MIAERRRAPRYPLRVEVKEINNQPGRGAYLLDIHPFGVKIEVPQPLEPTEVVELKAVLPGDKNETILEGEVIWLDNASDSPGSFIIGISLFQPHWEFTRFESSKY